MSDLIKLGDLSGDTLIIAEEILEAARKEGISDDIAKRIAVTAIVAVGVKTGGMNIYIHSTKEMLRPERNREIMRKFTGANVRQLAKDFQLSESHVRSIIRRESCGFSLSDLLENDK